MERKLFNLPIDADGYAAGHLSVRNCLLPMARTFIVVAVISFLWGCAPMQVAESAGARGQIVERGTQKPIRNAQICLDDVEEKCASSNVNGAFDLRPILKEKWQFIMIESFPYFRIGRFFARADGYSEQAFQANYFSSRVIEMDPAK